MIPCLNAGSCMDCADFVVEYCFEQILLPAVSVPTWTAQLFRAEPASSEEDASIRPSPRHSSPHGQ